MSLNRRLYTWLLGTDSAYFQTHGLLPLTNALRKLLIPQDNLESNPIQVCKIALALLDKWEIGGWVVPQLFTPVMETVFVKPDTSILASARALFDSMDPAVIWAELFSWIEEDKVSMLIWVVDKFNLREEEMLVKHIPQVLLHILCLLRHKRIQGASWFELSRKLIRLLPARALTSSKGVNLGSDYSDGNVMMFVANYYAHIRGHAGSDVPLPESIKGTYFHAHLLTAVTSMENRNAAETVEWVLEWTSLLRDTISTVPPCKLLDYSKVPDHLLDVVRDSQDFRLVATVIETTIALVQRQYIGKDALASSAKNVQQYSLP